jgi:hypothetical protein
MLKKLSIILFCLMVTLASRAQSGYRYGNNEEDNSKLHVGLGIGMDYGGVGFKVEYLPVKYVGIFGGLGYNLKDLGVNAGLQFRPLPDKKIQPILMAMYGYNGVLKIDGNSNYLQQYGLDGISKTYYGFSAGIGGELKLGRKGNRLYLGLWLPFRSQEFKDNNDIMKNSPYLDQKTAVSPIAYSIGFNWAL